ncbi:unnamed protein product [Haemonchus placei]|uniref:Uncharacterized protein n=1 Tax=Haemonchus placei TaxID=6290 RepID=A0A3P7VQ89_HAEPC|nr:unnamed protein product [Haemonchus placei]
MLLFNNGNQAVPTLSMPDTHDSLSTSIAVCSALISSLRTSSHPSSLSTRTIETGIERVLLILVVSIELRSTRTGTPFESSTLPIHSNSRVSSIRTRYILLATQNESSYRAAEGTIRMST